MKRIIHRLAPWSLTTWHDFVQRHFKTLWATDFFTKTVMTLRGPVTYYVLFFIHYTAAACIWRA